MSTAFLSHARDVGRSMAQDVADVLLALPEFAMALGRAVEASRQYERLSHMSDRELAAKGLTREELPNHICDTFLSR